VIKLICPECQHENEAERIYCHDCGARLDRSAVGSRISQKEGIDETRRRMRKLFDPTALKIRLRFFRIAKLILGAVALAALIQMILPPDVPQPTKTGLALSQINFDLENAIAHRGPTQLQYSEDQVNNHLQSVLKNKQSTLNKPFLEFRRGLVEFREGVCAFTVERSLFGFPIYTTAAYALRIGEDKPVVSSKGGSIGRLFIHPAIMQFGDILFADVWGALDRERKLVMKMGGIEFHDKTVAFTAPVPIQ